MNSERFVNTFTYPDRFPSSPRFAFDEAGTTSAAEAAPAAAPAPAAPATAPAGTPGAPDGGSVPSSSSPAGATPSPQEHDPFAGLDGDFGDDVIEIPAAPPTDGGAQVGAQAAPPAQVPPAAQPPNGAAPQEPSVAASSPPPAATPSATPVDQLSATIEGFKANAAALSAHAAQTLFKLSEEDATALATNAEEVIPRLMGQVYTQSIAAAGNLMRNFLPQMIEEAMSQNVVRSERSKEALNEFYSSNSDLNEKDHGQLVAKWAKTFRTANPSAPRKDAIAFVGRAIRAELGLPPLGAPPAARQAAFAPARPGGRTPPPPQENDPYAGLGLDFES